MSTSGIDYGPKAFSKVLFEKMKSINPGIEDLELYEFRYCLDNLYPEKGGWESIQLDPMSEIEKRINTRDYYAGIQLKPKVDGQIVLDETITRLTNMLFVGLVTGDYPATWINSHFYFDLRGFYFLTRTVYFIPLVVAHLGGSPFMSFDQKQKQLERRQEIGYKEFKAANAEVDQLFIASVMKLVAAKGTPILVTLAGPTAAGKTEIVERLSEAFAKIGKKITSIEMDNFLLDNDYRDDKGIKSLGKEAYHFDIFLDSIDKIIRGQPIIIPQYDSSISSHDPAGKLKPGYTPLKVEPADIIFLEGNFPFQIKEVTNLIGIKMVYLTDDPIRLRRKWRRDMDLRKKYNENYFRNRFFRTQFLRANDCYLAQMQVCDLVVHTTGAAMWTTPEITAILKQA
jgi:uridine kinase